MLTCVFSQKIYDSLQLSAPLLYFYSILLSIGKSHNSHFLSVTVVMKMALKSYNCDNCLNIRYTFLPTPCIAALSIIFILCIYQYTYIYICLYRKHRKNVVQYLCLFNAFQVCNKYIHILGE